MPATYTAQQKAAINEFVGITQADKSSAGKVLKQHNWNVSLAVNGWVLFFSFTSVGLSWVWWHYWYRGYVLRRSF